MYGLSRLKSAVSPAAATYQKRLLRFSSLFRSIHSKHSSSAAIDYSVHVGKGGKISGQSPIENQSKRNDGNKTYKRKVLPPELSRVTAMLTCESAADGGVCDVYLVGTCHISARSAQQAKAVIEFLKPQVVFLELCSSRLSGIRPPKKEKFGTIEVLRGAEFHLAYEEAIKYGAKVVLGDRPYEITMRRTWANASLWQITKLFSTALTEAVRLRRLENFMKEWKEMDDCDMLPPIFQEISKRCPALMEALVHERDQYMSATLLRVAREHNSVVAVVGRAHLAGIQKNWKQPVDLMKLLSVPCPYGKIILYVGATVCIISAIFCPYFLH